MMKKNHLIRLNLVQKPRTKQEIALILQISYSTLSRRINKAGVPRHPRLLLPKEQESLLELFGFNVNWVNPENIMQ